MMSVEDLMRIYHMSHAEAQRTWNEFQVKACERATATSAIGGTSVTNVPVEQQPRDGDDANLCGLYAAKFTLQQVEIECGFDESYLTSDITTFLDPNSRRLMNNPPPGIRELLDGMWETSIKPRLPANLQSIARESLRTPKDFLGDEMVWQAFIKHYLRERRLNERVCDGVVVVSPAAAGMMMEGQLPLPEGRVVILPFTTGQHFMALKLNVNERQIRGAYLYNSKNEGQGGNACRHLDWVQGKVDRMSTALIGVDVNAEEQVDVHVDVSASLKTLEEDLAKLLAPSRG